VQSLLLVFLEIERCGYSRLDRLHPRFVICCIPNSAAAPQLIHAATTEPLSSLAIANLPLAGASAVFSMAALLECVRYRTGEWLLLVQKGGYDGHHRSFA
jgi:hypothetical protein